MSRRPRSRGVVRGGVVALVAAGLLVVAVLSVANRHGGRLQGAFGGGPFDVGVARQFARLVATGGPLLFQDLLGHRRDLYVQHLGDDPAHGWVAFEAHAPGASRACQVRWERGPRDFRDPCDGHVYPADGQGLTGYPTTVDRRGHIVVDLRPGPLPSR